MCVHYLAACVFTRGVQGRGGGPPERVHEAGGAVRAQHRRQARSVPGSVNPDILALFPPLISPYRRWVQHTEDPTLRRDR